MRKVFIIIFILLTLISISIYAYHFKTIDYNTARSLYRGSIYINKLKAPLYKYPTKESKIIGYVNNRLLYRNIDKKNNYYKVVLPDLKTGYLESKFVNLKRIELDIENRKLIFINNNHIIKKYSVKLKNVNKGRYHFQNINKNKIVTETRVIDIRLYYKQGKINRSEYEKGFIKILRGETYFNDKLIMKNMFLTSSNNFSSKSPQIILTKTDLVDLQNHLPNGLVMLDVYNNIKSRSLMHNKNIKKFISASNDLLKRGCSYTVDATKYQKLSFPNGDISQDIGVCTDLVIRALRKNKLDLQALVYEDIMVNPRKYPKIKKADTNIDHRRVTNLKIFFERHSQVIPITADNNYKPGDIIIFDTGLQNGTEFDHIGIVSPRQIDGRYQVYNLWTIGYELNEMDLLNGNYPKVVGHYRLLHPYYYN